MTLIAWCPLTLPSVALMLLAISSGCSSRTNAPLAEVDRPATSRLLTVPAKPGPVHLDVATTALIVVDMQNDFGAKGGMLDRAGIDITPIQGAVAPTAAALAAARQAGIQIVYLKMAIKPDLSDMGPPGSPNRIDHERVNVGQEVLAPNGQKSRILIRDTWNTEILDELKPAAGDVVLYKNRFSGFYQTELDAILKKQGIRHLVFTGCTTSVCVESTVRDAMFHDYTPVVLADCMAEPIGSDLPRSNHEASLFLMEQCFGAVSTSTDFVQALAADSTAAVRSQ